MQCLVHAWSSIKYDSTSQSQPLMKRDRQSAQSSYTYEATFAAGSIGINLQTTRSGFGTYVDSFHRSTDNSLLPAELSGYIKLGDVMLEINGDDVSQMTLSEIPRVLAVAKRPVSMKFERVALSLTFTDTARDPRKLPWLMQYLVDSVGVEAAITDQAKIYLWLECDQYVHNYSILSEKDSCNHAVQIVKKFLTEGSTFSVLEQISGDIKRNLALLTESGSFKSGVGVQKASTRRSGRRHDNYLRLFRECQQWIEQDINNINFKRFVSSAAASRMTGYLVHSPPFEKMTLFDILRCDRRTMYMLAFLSQIKRHSTLYCYHMLRDEISLETSDDDITVEDIRGLTEKGFVCAYIFDIAESSAGAEDLPMITKLKEHISVRDTTSVFKDSPVPPDDASSTRVVSPSNCEVSVELNDTDPSAISENSRPRIDQLIKFPISSNIETVGLIRDCLVALRNSMLRELVQDLSPKFFASKEFEILLWELNEHRDQSLSLNTNSGMRRYSVDFDDDDSIGSDLRGSESGAVVPNGAVQRLLRKMTMPDNMTMHRAPLELLEEIRSTRASDGDRSGPLCWLSSFDTDFTAIIPDDVKKVNKSSKVVGPKLNMKTPVPIIKRGEIGETAYVSIVPQSIEEFFVPSGKIIWEDGCSDITFANQNSSKSTPSPKIFNFTLSGGGDVGLLYVAAAVFYRPLTKDEQHKWAAIIEILKALDVASTPAVGNGALTPLATTGLDFSLNQAPAIQGSTPVPTTKAKASFSDDVSLKIGISPTIQQSNKSNSGSGVSPKDAHGNSAYSNLKGKVDKLTSSPFFDKFKGITPPSMFRGTLANSASSEKCELVDKATLPSKPEEMFAETSDLLDLEVMHTPVIDVSPSVTLLGNHITAESPIAEKIPSISLNNFYGDLSEDTGHMRNDSSNLSELNQVFIVQHTAPSDEVQVSHAVADDFSDNSDSGGETISAKTFPKRLAVSGYCLVSKHPTIDTLRRPLYDILSKSIGDIDNFNVSKFQEVALSVSMKAEELLGQVKNMESLESLQLYISRNDQSTSTVLRSGGATDFDPNPILRNINPKNLVALFFALMLEQKIAVISSKLTALTCLGEFLREALVPFHWNHVYVPVLPKKMSAQILECPTPFFVGIPREFFDAKAVPSDVCVLDLDHDACRMSPELTRALKAGRRVVRALDNILRPRYVCCDELHPFSFSASAISEPEAQNADIANKVLSLLKFFSWEVLLGIHECGMSTIDHDEVVVLFDEAMFLSFKRRRALCSLLPADDAFLKPLLRTQAFSLAATTVVLKRLGAGSRPGSRGASPLLAARSRSISNASFEMKKSTPIPTISS